MSENNLNNETQSTESKMNKFKQEVKRLLPKHPKLLLLIIIICGVVVVLLAGSALVLKIIDGTEDSLLDAVSSVIASLSIDTSGTISSTTSVQDLWDELMDTTDSRVAEYLDTPEELARLIYAELLTQNVDTRENPDEEIDWDEVIDNFVGESSDDEDEEDEEESVESVAEIQGIIKFKRATQETDEDGNAVSETMTYVDYDTFFGWIDDYNTNGDEETKEKLMSHFTLAVEESTTNTSTEEDEEDETTTTMEPYAIVATWNMVEYWEENNDSEVATGDSYETYSITTTNIDYRSLVSGYTMPFNYLWEWLVVTENKDFVLELADLVYDSEIEITIYDNETVVTETETIEYTKYKEVTGTATVSYVKENSKKTITSGTTQETATEGASTEGLTHSYITRTTTNTLNCAVTLADVWMAKYEISITPNGTTPTEGTTSEGGTHEITSENFANPDYTEVEEKVKSAIDEAVEESFPSSDRLGY